MKAVFKKLPLEYPILANCFFYWLVPHIVYSIYCTFPFQNPIFLTYDTTEPNYMFLSTTEVFSTHNSRIDGQACSLKCCDRGTGLRHLLNKRRSGGRCGLRWL